MDSKILFVCCRLHRSIFYTEGEFVGELDVALERKTYARPLMWNTLAHLGMPMRLGVPWFSTTGL